MHIPRGLDASFTFKNVTTQLIQQSKARLNGLAVKDKSNRLAYCLFMVAKYERIVKNVSVPCSVLKQPHIFCFTLDIRSACSAKLLVNGTRRPAPHPAGLV